MTRAQIENWLTHEGYRPCSSCLVEGWWKLSVSTPGRDRESLWVLVPEEIDDAWLLREARFFRTTVEELRSKILRAP